MKSGKTQPATAATATSHSYGESALEASYQRWINKQLDIRALEYSEVHKLSLCCATWNVNAREINDGCDLKVWLTNKDMPPADIYVVGLQEIVDLNMMNVVVNSKASDDKSSYWQQKIADALQSTGVDFMLLMERHMVGLQLLVFARLSLKSAISDVRATQVYTGSYGVTGNKGGISVRFDVFDSALCFVCSHFHANRENVEQRNLDFHTIMEMTSFPPNNSAQKRLSLAEGNMAQRLHSSDKHVSFKASDPNATLTIANHEQIFWFGDLNYRIVEELEDDKVFQIVNRGQWQGLRSKDQLTVEKEKGNIFQNFEEGLLNFPPTYKFQPGTSIYEQRPGKKLRAPAWCDRVLWKATNRETVRQLSYQSALLDASDHKPVSAWFECGVRKVILERARAVYQELLFSVDKWINASTPKLALDSRMFDFGLVTIYQKYTQTMTLTNTGTVMAEWKFVPKNDELMVSKPWLKFSPDEGILAPGESISISANLYFAPDSTIGLPDTPNQSAELMSLEDIVILRVINGSDFFVLFNANVREDDVETARQSLRAYRPRTPPTSSQKLSPKYDVESDEEEES